MDERGSVETQHIGEITTVPDAEGWQVTYAIGLQGHELVVTGIAERCLIGIPAGGLRAQRARALIKPGTALREFVKAVTEGRVTPPMTEADVGDLVAAHDEGRAWQMTTTPEFLEYVAWVRELPALRQGQAVDRRHRIAQTASLYVEARMQGLPAPRKHVAKVQGRSDGAVRDDLHAARVEDPTLLTKVGQGHAGGGLTPEAIRLLKGEAER